MSTVTLGSGIGGLRQYLAFHVEMRQRHPSMLSSNWVYRGMEDFVLREGEVFLEFSPDQPHEGSQQNRYAPRALRQCFDNSYKAAVASRGHLRYVEGFAYSTLGWPVHHAWNADRDGRVVDVTWCGDGEHFRPAPGTAYMGAYFSLDFIRGTRTPDNTSMIDQWEHRWPVLSNPYVHPFKEVIEHA